MILIIDCGSKKSPHISSSLTRLGQENDLVKINDTWPSLNHYRGLIISGAPILITTIDPAPYLKKFAFLDTIEIPVLGICFGHQILGMIYGAEASRCKEERNPIHLSLDHSELFQGIDSNASFSEDHCEMISLPPNFTKIASSPDCNIEGIQHTSKSLFGVQFHPETSGENGDLLFQNFIRICNE